MLDLFIALVQPLANEVRNNIRYDSRDDRRKHDCHPLSGGQSRHRQYNVKILSWQVDNLLPKVCWCDILYTINEKLHAIRSWSIQTKIPELTPTVMINVPTMVNPPFHLRLGSDDTANSITENFWRDKLTVYCQKFVDVIYYAHSVKQLTRSRP